VEHGAPVEARGLRGEAVLADPLVRELLGLRLVAVLGTLASDGAPHLTPLWFADGGDAIVMATGSGSRKLANLARDARATLVLHDSRAGFDVRGASIAGTVEIVTGERAVPLVELVHRRYVAASAESLPAVGAFLASDDVALRLVPDSAWTWDQRHTDAARELRELAGALPLEPTA
jgi:hypothetical protein